MALSKMNDFSFKHSDQINAIYSVMDSETIKQKWDSRALELKQFLDQLIDKLNSIADGASGADNISMTPISSISTSTQVQAFLEDLVSYISNGSILENITAANVKSNSIGTGSGNNVQAQLQWLLSQVTTATLGAIPDGTITQTKLDQALVTKINEAQNTFTDTAASKNYKFWFEIVNGALRFNYQEVV